LSRNPLHRAKRVIRRASSTGLPFAHDLPPGPPQDREDFILGLCAEKRVIHLGFVDEHQLEAKRERGRWLHERLGAVASHLIGIDLDTVGVETARELGYEAYVADAQDEAQLQQLALEPADVVVAGEVIEHLESPGRFLGALRHLVAPGGLLIVTTPNASALTNAVAPLFGLELVHPDHMAVFSPHTLEAILERCGWTEPEVRFYQRRPRPDLAHGVVGRTLVFGRLLVSWVVRLVPGWSDGLIAVARRPRD
jgi:SAM-dependent methyltransferase